MKPCFAYIRVSTTRQGQTGTSLSEQREAIRHHAQRNNLKIVREYEEQETAAKRGRPVFTEMLRALNRGKAQGIIIHKIDRSARNISDWAELGELIDAGYDVYFANESLDLRTRGGRLAADIQAVVAADYIRNLREETKKGFYGRLKQGLYPMPARTGYADVGKGEAKIPDPTHAPLVRHAFELYGTGEWSLPRLAEHLHDLGLKNVRGGRVSLNGLSVLLHNPFYMGVIRIEKTGEFYPGKHEPIVSKTVFDRVQAVFAGKKVEKQHRHLFLFRKHLLCAPCGATLIGEFQKGHNYYRCHERTCPQRTIREELVESPLLSTLHRLRFNREEQLSFRDELDRMYADDEGRSAAHAKALGLQLDDLKARRRRLDDAFLDQTFDRESYLEKKNSLIMEEAALRERLESIGDGGGVLRTVEGVLEQANNAYTSYKEGIFDDKRELVKTFTSNLVIEEKTVLVKLHSPFREVAERPVVPYGSPQRDVARTVSVLLSRLCEYFRGNEVVTGSSSTEILTE